MDAHDRDTKIIGPWFGNVMLIDDCEIDRIHCERMLGKAGMAMKLFRYPGAREALDDLLDMARDHTEDEVDVVILDLHMPTMDGFDFLKAASETLGSDLGGAKVVMVTSDLAKSDLDRAARYPAVSMMLDKPLNSKDLERITHLTDS